MDGKVCWIDNRMIERLWRSLKYECIYRNTFETGSEARTGVGKWLAYDNTKRPHSAHGILTPDEAYGRKAEPMRLAVLVLTSSDTAPNFSELNWERRAH